MNVSEIKAIINEAQDAAYAAAEKFFQEKLGGVDRYACGFAWTNIYKYNGKRIDGRTKVGRAMKAAGVRQDWTGTFQIWNPAKFPVQNVDTLEAGARAAAKVFEKYGFVAYAGSRLD